MVRSTAHMVLMSQAANGNLCVRERQKRVLRVRAYVIVQCSGAQTMYDKMQDAQLAVAWQMQWYVDADTYTQFEFLMPFLQLSQCICRALLMDCGRPTWDANPIKHSCRTQTALACGWTGSFGTAAAPSQGAFITALCPSEPSPAMASICS